MVSLDCYLGPGLVAPYIQHDESVYMAGVGACACGVDDEVCVMNDELRTINLIELPLPALRDVKARTLDEIEKAVFGIVKIHHKEPKLHRKMAYESIKSGRGDCIDKSAIGIALARNAGLPSRMVGVDECTAYFWDEVRPVIPRTVGYVFYEGMEAVGVLFRYESQPTTVRYFGKVPQDMLIDGAFCERTHIFTYRAMMRALAKAIGEPLDGFTPSDNPKVVGMLRKGVELSFDDPLVSHCWFEVYNDGRWNALNTFDVVDPAVKAVVSALETRRKEFAEFAWNGKEYKMKNC